MDGSSCAMQNGTKNHNRYHQPQTNLHISNLSSRILPSIQTYEEADQTHPCDDSEDIVISHVQNENNVHSNQSHRLKKTTNSSVDLLSSIDSDLDLESEQLSDQEYPENLNPFHKIVHQRISKSKSSIKKRTQQNLGNLSLVERVSPDSILDTSTRSATSERSAQSVPVEAHKRSWVEKQEFQHTRSPNFGSCTMAADISKSRYALQNKKLLEELEHRTYELATVKRQLKEVGGRSALQGDHLRTFDQRILSLESEVRIQDKKLRDSENKLGAYQQQLAHCETQLAISHDENDHLKRRIETLADDKQNMEKQRNEAVKNLEEMTKNMAEYRSHIKMKLEKYQESEQGLKKQLEEARNGIETYESSIDLKNKTVKELQAQVADLRKLIDSKDEKVQDLNGRVVCLSDENDLLKESNTITSTALSDLKIELETLKREQDRCEQRRDNFSWDNTDLKQLLNTKDAEIATLKAALANASRENEAIMTRIESENVAEPDLHDYSAVEAEKTKLKKQIRELESSLKAKTTEVEAVKSQLSLWSSQYDEAKNFINANDCLVMRLERDNQQKQNIIESCRKEMNSLKVKVEDAKNEIVTVEGKLKRSQMEYHQLKIAYNEILCKSENLSKKLQHNSESFSQKEADYEAHIDQLREELKELTNNFELLAGSAENKDKTIRELQNHFDVMLPNLDSVKAELTSLNSAHNQLKEQSSLIQEEKKKQIKHLEAALAVYKEEVEKLKLQLRHQKDNFRFEKESSLAEVAELKAKIDKYESQLNSTKHELSLMDSNVKNLENELTSKEGKISELELNIAQILKEKSEVLEKHSKDSTNFEDRYDDLNKLYQSVNLELEQTREKLSVANENVGNKSAKISQLEDLCKDNDTKIKSFIEQLESKSQILEREQDSKCELQQTVTELQDQINSKTVQVKRLAEELKIMKDRYQEIDKTFSEYYKGSQDVLNHNRFLTEKVKDLQTSVQALQKTNEDLKENVAQANDQVAILQSLLSEKQVECANKQHRVVELEHNEKMALKDKSELHTKFQGLESRFEKVSTEAKDFEQKVKILEGQIVMKEDQISMREDKIALLTSKLDSVVKLDDSNLKKLEEVTRSASEKSEEAQKVKLENSKYREQLKTNEAELSKLYKKNSDLDDKVQKLLKDIEALRSSKKMLSEELNLKASNVESLTEKVHNFEEREIKLQAAVTDEIARLKSVVQRLTEEHNKELSDLNDQFKSSFANKDSQLRKIVQELQQCSFREQILRNDLAQAINQINYFKNNRMSPNETASSDSPTSYTLEHVQHVESNRQHSNSIKKDSSNRKTQNEYVVYPLTADYYDNNYSTLTGKGFQSYPGSARSPRSPRNIEGMNTMDKVTEIKSDPMLLNFHFLPHDSHEIGSSAPRTEEVTKSSNDMAVQLLRPHQTLYRTSSDSNVAKSSTGAKRSTDAVVSPLANEGSSKLQKEQFSHDEKRGLENKRIPEVPKLQISTDVVDLFREDHNSKSFDQNLKKVSSKTTEVRTYTVPLAEDSERMSAKDKRKKKISVQEMSLTYNSEDELMNQSFHSLSASEFGGSVSRVQTPLTSDSSFKTLAKLEPDEGNFSTVSLDVDGDRVANSTGTDEEFIRMLDANSRRRKELEEKLNLLVEKTGTVLAGNDSDA